MRLSLCLGLAVALVSAAPAPQNINFDAVKELPTVAQGPAVTATKQLPTYDPSAAASSAAAVVASSGVDGQIIDMSRRKVVKRAECARQSWGSAPSTNPDTDVAFLSNPNYTAIASGAATPQGYQNVFTNLQGSTSQNGYMGIITYTSYNTIECQRACDAAAGCMAFNLFIERDPLYEPAAGCPNPPSTANYICTLWGLPISNMTATNQGQWRGPSDINGTAFHVVVAASNGYVKNTQPPSYTNFTGPVQLGGAIQAPLSPTTHQNTYIGMKVFNGPYNPLQCASACQATTDSNRASAVAANETTYTPCNFFNSYVLSQNNEPVGTYCTFYTEVWGRDVATNVGQWDNEGNWFTVSSSYGYALTDVDAGVVQ